MTKQNAINEFVRSKLRKLRLAKSLTLTQLAAQAGLPYSSYACMESGFYNINLDNLFRILDVLGADISEVWPTETAGLPATDVSLYLKKIQEFRLGEIVSLCAAEGGALFAVRNDKCSLPLYHRLSDFLLDRLVLYLEDGRKYPEGLWFEKTQGDTTFHLFLKTEDCPAYVKKLVEQYLVIWSNLFCGVLIKEGTRPGSEKELLQRSKKY